MLKVILRSVAAVIVAAAIVAVLVIATRSGALGGNLATVDQLDEKPGAGTATIATMSAEDNGCFFVTVNGTRAFAIWPTGFVQKGDDVESPDGTRYADGDEFTATVAMTTRPKLGFTSSDAASEGPLSLATQFCLADEPDKQTAPVAVMTAVAG